MVGVELSTGKIKETLAQIGNSRGGQTVLFNLERGWEINSGSDLELHDLMKQLAFEKQAAKIDEGYDTIHYKNKRFLTVFKYSTLWNSYTVTCIPEEMILGSLQVYRALFWWACALAVCIFYFYLFYHPINIPSVVKAGAFLPPHAAKRAGADIDRPQAG